MTGFKTLVSGATAAMATVLLLASVSPAATSFSNSLTGFTGNSTQAGTQGALLGAGFDFFSTDGLSDDLTTDPAVSFDANGAHFGQQFALDGFGGDGGRNYVRTTQPDFSSGNFTAEITIVTPDLKTQDVFFGLGAGETALFGWPDWSTQNSSVLVLPEITDSNVSQLTTFYTQDDFDDGMRFAATPAPTLLNGTHRIRMAFDSTAKTATFSVDVNYAGGPFVADVTAAPVDVSTLYSDTGWPSEPAKIYFGGDDGAVFKDFSVTVITPVAGDFNSDGKVDGADFLLWQKGFGTTTGATLAQGDANADGAVNAADLAIWKGSFGAGAAVAAVSGVPEPGAILLLCLAAAVYGLRRRSRRPLK